MENEIMYIKLDDIIPNRFQPREIFDEEALEKLAESIKNHGVIEPIIVRPVSNKFEIVAGERRYKASVLAGLTKIPAIVKQMDDKESSVVAYIENEHRAGVSAIEEARTIERILKSNDMTQEDLAKELGINQSTIANKLRLLNLPIEIQDALMHNEISERHARSLLSVKEEDKQLELLNKIKEKKMTVRELEGEIKSMYNESNTENNNVLNMYEKDIVGSNKDNIANQTPSYSESTDKSSGYFMNFLSNYDNNGPLPQVYPREKVEIKPLEEKNHLENEPMNMDNIDKISNEQVDDGTKDNNDFINFLNNYDKNHPIDEVEKQDNSQSQENLNANQNSDFLSFLNNYENNNTTTEIPPVSENVTAPSAIPLQNNDYINNMNSYELPQSNVTMENNLNNNYEKNENPYINPNYNENINNVAINDVAPPISTGMDANQYVENNPNYVDVSQNILVDNVDDIINRLKSVIDDIKATSSLKIDTDEINFDDIYQITIKIDKRNF